MLCGFDVMVHNNSYTYSKIYINEPWTFPFANPWQLKTSVVLQASLYVAYRPEFGRFCGQDTLILIIRYILG